MSLTWDEIAEENGFIHSTFSVITEDDYILTIMRISGHEDEPIDDQWGSRKRPVLF